MRLRIRPGETELEPQGTTTAREAHRGRTVVDTPPQRTRRKWRGAQPHIAVPRRRQIAVNARASRNIPARKWLIVAESIVWESTVPVAGDAGSPSRVDNDRWT
jgi:hypothetical protein